MVHWPIAATIPDAGVAADVPQYVKVPTPGVSRPAGSASDEPVRTKARAKIYS
jgi:hypothetical protein